VLDAVRDAGNRWVFPEQLADGLEPWGGVAQIWAPGSPRSRHGVDVTDTFDQGVASLRAHDAYLRGLGSSSFDPEELLEGVARPVGTRLGCRYGVAFEVFPLRSF
jgi:LmbE family N-acetylglucosaminyl deacetylase